MKIFITLLILTIYPVFVFAQTPKNHQYFEKDYQKVWCDAHCGSMEVILTDKARVDCVTATHAIEFDFAPKWAESIGQALYYGEVLQKQPGIVLIIENLEKDPKYINRVKTVAGKNGITLWLMYPEDIKNTEALSKIHH